ncbi:prelamin-A/C-like isoform X1 [Gymnodraco acuticeps]|uniref:Prelamin-A/C-like isoform X1 n=1 Tax=Gymnodraco acuticeps TaxID=8218 RepID=A0A6P8X8G9_GYMAC|nr:prelamin-A/C-like isoform X1 [Gymnodraco acuticeps]
MMERTTDCLGVAMKRLKRLLVSRQKFKEEEQRREEAERNVHILEEQQRREEAERNVHILEEKLQKKVLMVPEKKTSREDAEKDLKHTVPPSASSPSYGVSKGNQQPHEKKRRGKEAWGFAKKFQLGRCEEFYNSQSVEPHRSRAVFNHARTPRTGFNIEVRQQGICIRLKNSTTEDKLLGDAELHLQVNDNKTCMYTFDRSFKLKAGRFVTMWAAGYGPNRSNTELEWKDLKPWKTGDRLWFTINSFWL